MLDLRPDDWFNKMITIFFSQGCTATLVQLAYFVIVRLSPSCDASLLTNNTVRCNACSCHLDPLPFNV